MSQYFDYYGFDVFANVLEDLVGQGHMPGTIVTSSGPRGDVPCERTISIAQRIGVRSILVTNHKQVGEVTRELRSDLAIVCGFPFRIPKETISQAKVGFINLHPTLLPKYRGPWPQPWQILNCDTVSGVTMHLMDEGFDSGPILLQLGFAFSPLANHDALITLQQRVAAQATLLTIRNLPYLLSKAERQDDALASYFGMPTEAVRQLDWTGGVEKILRTVRAFGTMCSWAHVGTRDYLVRSALAGPEDNQAATPGTVLKSAEGEMLIAASDGTILLSDFVDDPTTQSLDTTR